MNRNLIVLLMAICPSLALADAPVQHTVSAGGAVQNISVSDGTVIIDRTDGERFTLQNKNGQFVLTPSSTTKPQPLLRPDDILPDGGIVVGDGAIRRAWLSSPTERYGHGVLGDQIEGGAVSAELADQQIVTLSLDKNAVFEDRTPRLVDIDGDGQNELLIVKTFLERGAALAVISANDHTLEISAEALPIGLSHRWLNPVGVADFDGDGINEIAAVITPHIGGTLQLYEWRGRRLVEDHSQYGFSNHQMGSQNQDLSAVLDLNNDGVMDILLPDAGRGALVGVTFKGGNYKELLRVHLGGTLTAPIRTADLDGDGRVEIIFAIAPDRLVVLSLAP